MLLMQLQLPSDNKSDSREGKHEKTFVLIQKYSVVLFHVNLILDKLKLSLCSLFHLFYEMSSETNKSHKKIRNNVIRFDFNCREMSDV